MSAQDASPPPAGATRVSERHSNPCVGHLIQERGEIDYCQGNGESRKRARPSPPEEGLPANPPPQMLRRVTVSEGRIELEDSRCISEGTTVFLWDLDETLVVFNSLWNGSYAKQYEGTKDPVLGAKLGRCWEKLILNVCDKFFFFEEVEDFCEPNISSLIEYDDGADLSGYDFRGDEFKLPSGTVSNRKLAYRHRYSSQLYSQGLEGLLSEEQLAEWTMLYEATDKYSDGWLSSGRKILAECLKVSSRPQVESNSVRGFTEEDITLRAGGNGSIRSGGRGVNVLVTSGVLIPSIVKCLLFKLNEFIDCDKIYSARIVDKLTCFRGIKERFSHPGNRFCVIGDGREECKAAERLGWPFVKVESGPDGVNRLPTLTIETVQLYMRVIYDEVDAMYDDEDVPLYSADDGSNSL